MTRDRGRIMSNEYPQLVGHTGNVVWDERLHPLKMNKKYKNFLLAAERARKSKNSDMFCVIEQYWELCGVLSSLEKENENNSNLALIMELEDRKFTLKKKLLYLQSNIDYPLPATLNKYMKQILNCDSPQRSRMRSFNCVKKRQTINSKKNVTLAAEKHSQKTSSHGNGFSVAMNVNERAPEAFKRGIWRGSVQSQIFVRKNSQVITISIDLFTSGKNLIRILTDELGEDASKYILLFGTKKLDVNKSLFEQEIYHGTTIDLHMRLRGGKGKGKKQKKKKPRKKDLDDSEVKNPLSWSKQEVAEWISKVCKEDEIDESEVDLLQNQNGKGLDDLPEELWIRRSPKHGDKFFLLWQNLKKRHGVITNEKDENLNTEYCEVSSEMLPETEIAEEYFGASSETRADVNEACSAGDTIGVFGKVENLALFENLESLETFSSDGASPSPAFDSVISVKGLYEKKQLFSFDNEATLVIGDDSPMASSVSHKMKIVIRSDESSTKLKTCDVEKMLKGIRPNMHVAVTGRVERLESEDEVTADPHCEMIRFKLVVDSDNCNLVYSGGVRPSFSRQFSQPWWIQESIDSSVSCWNLKAGDRIEKRSERVFCEATVTDEEILNYVVAFKNCYDGEIFTGVDKDGKVTGRTFSDGEMENWREKMSMAITSILPDSNAAICFNLDEAVDLVHENKCFVCVLPLSELRKNRSGGNFIGWIHVPKGETAPIYFRKEKNIHSFIRKGAENKRITNYEELFSSLYSLGSRRKPREISVEDLDIETKYKESIGHTGLQLNYMVLEPIRFCENQKNELKMIFGHDPVKTIVDKYLTEYTCGFLNGSGGTVLFGAQEAKKSKLAHIVGIVVPPPKRRELLQKAVTALSEFYPPVTQSQFRLIFHKVNVPHQNIVRSSMINEEESDMFVLLRGPPEEIGTKWPNFVKDKLKKCLSRVIPVKPECFCIVVESEEVLNDVVKISREFVNQNSKFAIDLITPTDLKQYLKHLCLIELKVSQSQYPIHLIRPIETNVFDKQGTIINLTTEKLMRRFELGKDSERKFDVNKFLSHVETFQQSGNSYILITSPFELRASERDLHGLVLPQWTLAIDFDQHPKQEGHLCCIFKELNDIHQQERQLFIATPQNTKLGLDSEHAICWLAARGYEEDAKTLSKQDHGHWNISHRGLLTSLLKAELPRYVKPNYLNILVLWDDGQESLIDSLRTILEDLIAINGYRTAVTIVCSTPEASLEMSENLVQPLQKNYWQIITKDRVYVAPPYVLSRHLSYTLPSPCEQEYDYQVPHKKEYKGKYQVFPDILPQGLSNNISRFLKMMYMKKGKLPEKAYLDEERRKFYSGSKISDFGLRNKFGIEREKLKELEKEFSALSNDRRSHVSVLCLKVDRGAGSSTLCLQFLYKHHKDYPCAQLLEIDKELLGYIRAINSATKLPLLLFVDEEISHPQDFLDFTNDLVKCYNINVILLLIVPAEAKRTTNSAKMKNVADSHTLRACPFKEIELRRELTVNEMENLAKHLVDVKREKSTVYTKLEKLMNKAKTDKIVLTFAHFGLTAFGREFKGLQQFVEIRLDKADEKQKKVLSFLSLIHIYTDSYLPACALSSFLETNRTVDLEEQFDDDYLRELLSPPMDNKDSRRMSFHEVAEEVLLQLGPERSGANADKKYWQFIKQVAVDLAKDVLSVNIATKSIDRLTRRLFVTSEYESEKFSSLIRAMKEANFVSIARDTLTELKDVFQKHLPFRAHILAHLAKYYMIVEKKFDEARPKIEEAIKDQEDDSLLQHIHGDIILRHVRALKNEQIKSDKDIMNIVSYAKESSDSFKIVRRKRPHDSHGYMSDAMVRITVMQAAKKYQDGKILSSKNVVVSFVDYLTEKLEEIRARGKITKEEQYLISLIPKSYGFLYEGVSDDFEYKEEWKKQFRNCIGALSNLRRLCDKIREVKSDLPNKNSTWLHEILLGIQSLNNGFEIDKENLTPEQIEERIKEIEECAAGLKNPEPVMRFWIRYSRDRQNVPHLDVVKKKVKGWLRSLQRHNKPTLNAEFYKYVVYMLIALQDSNDDEKREKVESIQPRKVHKKDNVVIPQEWLHPRNGHHINSIDSLLHHDDLVQDKTSTRGSRKQQPGREVIEGYLRQKGITRWTGTVTDVQKLWIGTITFKKYFDVRFIPQSVTTGKPQSGETVSFCLGFDRLGLSAWWVRHEDSRKEPLEGVKTISYHNNDEQSTDEEEESKSNNEASTSSFTVSSINADEKGKPWDCQKGKCLHGVVFSTYSERGFGYLKHPDVHGELFFHALQLAKPVIALNGSIERFMVLYFKVEKLSEKKTRASDIHVVKEEDIPQNILEFREKLKLCPSPRRRRKEIKPPERKPSDTQVTETGVVLRHSKDKTYGFIKADSTSYQNDIFFHLRCLAEKGSFPDIGQRVWFYVVETSKGLEANPLWVKMERGATGFSKDKWNR
ncbi:uncharacterized protein LOC114534346 [Dendronephthya gigantea]|uniref:uncharacterized protein LOC114534346 n=1 Tax=Dendronephthya gigantea TaxID=151771 RepID=UPI00106CBB80|nr:uncharacterized protein LOC114534346 [Dendronephthya gigantea]